MASIGEILKQERENRGLSLQGVYDATKITPQNLTALEEDRFDSFPNRVYARAFLRDYANFLGIESAGLLTRYEDEWHGSREVEVVPTIARKRSPWRAIGYAFLVILILGMLAAAGYFGLNSYETQKRTARVENTLHGPEKKPAPAELPKVAPVAPAMPEAPPAATPQPEPEPAVAQGVVLEVTASRPVWADIKTDGVKGFYGTFPAGTKTYQAKKEIYIRVGQATAVQLKLNGQALPPLGTTANPAKQTFKAAPPAAEAAPAAPAAAP